MNLTNSRIQEFNKQPSNQILENQKDIEIMGYSSPLKFSSQYQNSNQQIPSYQNLSFPIKKGSSQVLNDKFRAASNLLGKRSFSKIANNKLQPKKFSLPLSHTNHEDQIQLLIQQNNSSIDLLDMIFESSPAKKERAENDSLSQQSSKRQQKIARKSSQQLQALEIFFKQNPFPWTQELVVQVATETGLSMTQVYKWGWDQRSKLSKRYLLQQHACQSRVQHPHFPLLIQEQDNLDQTIQQQSLTQLQQNTSNIDKLNSEFSQAEMQRYIRLSTDEFGGYSKPKWNQSNVSYNTYGSNTLKYQDENQADSQFLEDQKDDENLCKLVGIDIETKLQELLLTIKYQDQKEREQDETNKEIDKVSISNEDSQSQIQSAYTYTNTLQQQKFKNSIPKLAFQNFQLVNSHQQLTLPRSRLESENFFSDMRSTTANTRENTPQVQFNDVNTHQIIHKIKVQLVKRDLQCHEELISQTEDLDCDIDKVGDMFRQRLNQYRANLARKIQQQIQQQTQATEALEHSQCIQQSMRDQSGSNTQDQACLFLKSSQSMKESENPEYQREQRLSCQFQEYQEEFIFQTMNDSKSINVDEVINFSSSIQVSSRNERLIHKDQSYNVKEDQKSAKLA
ncbi:UNKNOWN [Stylonychia lemnae]|uniref:Homeobox domain-containing protein n=1 Tax=Stylonychia lemnae TaxID=5949 RepID=A0A078AE27_STYLE|nr:UNKNOWN [Stylonychia lemnae]|eukprot:CDW80096.1 UNKNOWN [Stylonychia lemnae]